MKVYNDISYLFLRFYVELQFMEYVITIGGVFQT